jgi:hypothetical protein
MPLNAGADADHRLQAEHWLAVLQAGNHEEQHLARTELGLILEQLGLRSDAIEAYRANVAAHVLDRRPYERLAALARAEDDPALEATALRALADLLDPPAPASRPPAEVAPLAAPMPSAGPDLAPVEPPRPVASSGALAWRGPSRLAGGVRGAVQRRLFARSRGLSFVQARPEGGASVHWAALVAGAAVALIVVVLGFTDLVPLTGVARSLLIGSASNASSGSPDVVAFSPVLPVVADAPSPAPIDLRLVADAMALASPTVAMPAPLPLASPSPVLVAVPERCSNASVRFPETRDTEAAIRAAFREYLARQGVTMDPTSALFTGLGEAYVARHSQVVAGWMAVTLQRERRGLSTFSLTDYVASDVVVAVGANEYQLRATVSPQGWADITSWPASSCEGAFIRDPANAHWVELMQATVGDITWALPPATH